EPPVSAVVRDGGVHARRSELEHPANVVRRDEVPRRPQDVRAQDPSLIDLPFDVGVSCTMSALTERPFGSSVILRLDGTEGAHDVTRSRQTARRQELAGEAKLTDLAGLHVSRARPRSLCVVKSLPSSPPQPLAIHVPLAP